MTNMKIQYASDLHLEFADNWRYLKAHPLEVTGIGELQGGALLHGQP